MRTRLKELIAAASVVIGMAGSSSASTVVSFYEDASTNTGLMFTITCSLACAGIGGDDASEGQLFQLSSYSGSGTARYEDAVETETGTLVDFVSGSELTAATNPVITSADFVTWKIGGGTNALDLGIIANLSGGENSYTYTIAQGRGINGLSNTRQWTCEDGQDCGDDGEFDVPVPASLPLLAGALGLAGIWLRRKQKAA